MTTQATPPSEVLLVVVLFSQLGKIKKGTAKIFFSSWENISPQYGNYTKKSKQSVQLYTYKTLADLVVAIQ